MSGKLTIKVIEAQLTQVSNPNAKLEPSWIVTLGSQRFTGKTCSSGGKNPKWDDEMALEVRGEPEIYVELKDKDVTTDEILGVSQIVLQDVITQKKLSQWYPLYYNQGTVGQILLELTFTAGGSTQQEETVKSAYPTQVGYGTQQAYPQPYGGAPQGGYPQQTYPVQTGYPQQTYPQQTFPVQTTYPQQQPYGGYPQAQPTYVQPQTTYMQPQTGYVQPGYVQPQGGYVQVQQVGGGYPQQGYAGQPYQYGGMPHFPGKHKKDKKEKKHKHKDHHHGGHSSDSD